MGLKDAVEVKDWETAGGSNRTIVGLKDPDEAAKVHDVDSSNRTIVGLKAFGVGLTSFAISAAIAPLWD